MEETIIDIKSIDGFKRINIVGSPGSGKSTLAERIGDILNITVYDLDIYLYDKNCKRLNSLSSLNAISTILLKDSFIIDGTYTTTFQNRLKFLDLVILTDRYMILNIFTFILRLFTKKNLKCGERLTLKTLVLLFKFNYKSKHKIINDCRTSRVKIALYKRREDRLVWLK